MVHMLSATQLSAVFSILSPLVILILIPLGLSAGGGPAPVNFGNPEELARLLRSMPKTMWIETLALAAPTLALGAGYGWWVMLKPAGSYVGWAVLLWYLGMIFIIFNDALELAFAAQFPSAYATAPESSKHALLVLGASMSSAIDACAVLGGIVSFFGAIFITLAMMHFPGLPPWLGWLGLIAVLTLLFTRALSVPFKRARALGLFTLVGFVLYMVWMIITGIFMWKYSG